MTDTTGPPAPGWVSYSADSTPASPRCFAGGVAIYAVNEFVTISLLPDVVADIGGERIYAWVTTVYLVASVVAATTVSPALQRFGPRWSYLGALNFRGRKCPVRNGTQHGDVVGGASDSGSSRRNAGGIGLCGHQRRFAQASVDPRVGGGVRDVGAWARLSGPPRVVCSPNSVCGVGDSGYSHFWPWRCGLVVFSVPVRERHRGQGCARTGFPCCRYPYSDLRHWR